MSTNVSKIDISVQKMNNVKIQLDHINVSIVRKSSKQTIQIDSLFRQLLTDLKNREHHRKLSDHIPKNIIIN